MPLGSFQLGKTAFRVFKHVFVPALWRKKLRAYKDSPASNMIDFSKVEIPSNGKLKEAVYFNFDDDVQMDFARLEFFYEWTYAGL